MERKPNPSPIGQIISQAEMEWHYLNYFNNRLLKEGLLIPEEHRLLLHPKGSGNGLRYFTGAYFCYQKP